MNAAAIAGTQSSGGAVLMGQAAPFRAGGKLAQGQPGKATAAASGTITQASPPAGGFLDLVNQLLAPHAQNPVEDAAAGAVGFAANGTSDAASTDAAAAASDSEASDRLSSNGPVPVDSNDASASPQIGIAPVAASQLAASQLADAMIRSMFTSAGNVASLSASGAGSSGTGASRASVSAAGTSRVKGVAASSVKTSPGSSLLPGSLATATAAGAGSLPPLSILSQPEAAHRAGMVTASANALPARTTASRLPFAPRLPSGQGFTPAPLAFSMRIAPAAESGTPSVPAPLTSAPPAPAAISATELAETGSANGELSRPAAAAQPEPATAAESTSSGSKPQAGFGTAGGEAKTRADAQSAGESAPMVTAATAAAGNDDSGDLARQMQGSVNPNATPGGAAGKTQAWSGPAGPAASSAPPAPRATEPAVPPPGGVLKEIAIRIATPQAPAVDVHLVARAGQLQVSVRTADGGLQASLRQNVGSLVNSLERTGYRAEAFTPRDASPVAALSSQANSQDGRQDSDGGSGGRNGGQEETPQDSGRGQQQPRRDPRQPQWNADETD